MELNAHIQRLSEKADNAATGPNADAYRRYQVETAETFVAIWNQIDNTNEALAEQRNERDKYNETLRSDIVEGFGIFRNAWHVSSSETASSQPHKAKQNKRSSRRLRNPDRNQKE